MNPIYSFMDEYEREIACANRELDIAMTEAAVMAENITRQLTINMALSELKVMQESGTAEDLTMLILEAGEEAAQQNEGLISKIFSAIASFFQGIANGLKNFFSKNKPAMDAAKAANAMVDIDGETDNMLGLLGKAAPQIEAASNAKDHKTMWKALAAAAGVFTTGFIAFKASGKLFDETKKAPNKQIPVAEAEQKMNWLTSLLDKLRGVFSKKAQETGGGNIGNAKPGAADAAHQKTEQKRAEINQKNQAADARASEKEAKAQKVAADMRAKGLSEDQIQQAVAGIRTSDEGNQAYRNSQNAAAGTAKLNAQKAAAANFIGMFEAAADGSEEEGKTGLNFLEKMITWLSNTIKAAINAVLAKFGQKATNVAGAAVNGAVNGAANAVADATQPAKKGLFGKKFIGDDENDDDDEDPELVEESAGSDVDPIEVMLSGLALGGCNG